MEQIFLELKKLSAELVELKSILEDHETARIFDGWIPRNKLKNFFNYEDTQLSALLNSGNLQVAQIGNRKFIKKESILKLLEESIK